MGTKRITCKFCGEYMKSYDLYVSHIESSHSEFIPQDMTAWRFVYYLKTGKTHGSCIICKNETEWNEKTHKYHRFCNNPKCKEKYVETFQNRMIGKYGKVNLLNDPEQQKKMLANRKISGVYTWRDHVHETPYTGTYELSFLKFLDEIMEFDPDDVIGPSPHTYYYIYEGKKHFYIPDFFIPSLNLEIEIKEGTNNHPKIQAVDKVKERLKDEVMKSNSNSFNYIKIIEKNNFRFIEFLDEAKKRFLNGDKRPIVMCESVEDNLFDDLITENKIINDKDIYYNFDDIVAFNKMLNEYEYIIPNKGNIITRVTLESWNKYYLLTPSEFEKYHGGICWDYVVYETFYFKKYFSGVKFETYFQVVDDGKNYPSHTFLIFEYNNKYYWFESSWKPEAGIYGFNTKNDAINYAMDKLKLDDEYNRYICIYDALDKKMFGMNCDQYMNYMWDKVKPYKYSGIIKNPVISIKNKIQLPITESVEDNLFDELITENIGDKYIRITYNGNGIYQEFKENVSFNVWKEFKNSNATKWLPIPPAYEGNYKSYFTIKGYKMFMKETYPFIIKYLDKNKIKVEEIHFNDSPNVVYKDEFQIVVDGNSDIITESNKSHLYHISNRQNIKTINPSIPINFMTKNNYEENKTKRVCFAPSIEQCLMGLSRNCEGEEFYVYIPVKHYKTYSPNIKDVPDSGITGEIWIKEPVDVICLGKIKVLDTNKSPGKLYTYGNGKTAELYAFDYKWIERYKQKESPERTKNYIRDEQKVVTESVDNVTNKPIIKTKNTYMIKNDKGTIISKLNYYEYKVKNFDWILMADLDTKPDYRGRGLATKLINELYSDITKNTNKGLYLFVKSDNRTAIRLYTKLNFKKVKNYTLEDGEYIIMAKGNADMSQFDKMNFS